MKNKLDSAIFMASLSILILIFVPACKKNSEKAAQNSKPTVSTDSPSQVTYTGAKIGGTISADGGETVTSRGIYISLKSEPSINGFTVTLGSGIGNFSIQLDTLRPNTQYYIQAYATNSIGTMIGDAVSFSTLKPAAPSIHSQSASNITQNNAIIGGNVISANGSAVSERGIWFGSSQNPETSGGKKIITGTGTGKFFTTIDSLSAETKYYFKSYAINALGQALGRELSFNTTKTGECLNCDTGLLSDNSGYTYKTIVIGTQTWMAENLSTIRFSNGDPIATTPFDKDISGESTPTYQWSTICESSKPTYGRLYTWYTVTDIRGVCPSGWHVPADSEYETLSVYLGGNSISGAKLKSIGTVADGDGLYLSPNTDATNESGFSALPNVFFDANCKCNSCNDTKNNPNGSTLWTSTPYLGVPTWALTRGFDVNSSTFLSGSGGIKQFGLAVRCLKNK